MSPAARRRVTFTVLAVGLAAALFLSVRVGAVPMSAGSMFRLAARALGIGSVQAPPEKDAYIIVYLRLPRALSAMLVGGTLALCGVAMQGLFRNPMASPDILGVSSGGALGAVIAITTGLSTSSMTILPIMTAAGALLAAFIIYGLSSHRGRTGLLFVVLAGLAISSFFNGLVSAILLFSKEYEVSQFIFWTMGGLDGRMWRHVLIPAPVLFAGAAALVLLSRELNLFAFGEESAHSLGMNVERTKRIVLGISALLTGVAISIAGPVGFVGLLVPHLFRFLVGPDHRTLIPASILGGALFLVLADLIGRTIAPPYEIRVGIVTALLGSPYFLFLIVRYQRRGFRGF